VFTSSFKKEKFIQILGSQRTNLRKPYDVLKKIRINLCGGRTTKVAHLLVLSQTEDKHVLSCIPVGMIRMGLIKSIQSELMVFSSYNAWGTDLECVISAKGNFSSALLFGNLSNVLALIGSIYKRRNKHEAREQCFTMVFFCI
jgi:hypothetical protein